MNGLLLGRFQRQGTSAYNPGERIVALVHWSLGEEWDGKAGRLWNSSVVIGRKAENGDRLELS